MAPPLLEDDRNIWRMHEWVNVGGEKKTEGVMLLQHECLVNISSGIVFQQSLSIASWRGFYLNTCTHTHTHLLANLTGNIWLQAPGEDLVNDAVTVVWIVGFLAIVVCWPERGDNMNTQNYTLPTSLAHLKASQCLAPTSQLFILSSQSG